MEKLHFQAWKRLCLQNEALDASILEHMEQAFSRMREVLEHVTGANVHDSRVFHELLAQVMARVGRPYAVAVDAGYKTPAIAHLLRDEGIRPVMPYTRPKGPPGRLRKQDFVYDAYLDAYLCPENQALHYRTTNLEGYQEYVSDPAICQRCPLLESCTQSQDHRKVIFRHVWQDDLDEAEHLRHTPWNRMTYAERKETIERIFADLKQKHGLRWTLLAGGVRNTAHAMLVYAAMNLKKLATWRGRQTYACSLRLLFPLDGTSKGLRNPFSEAFVYNLRRETEVPRHVTISQPLLSRGNSPRMDIHTWFFCFLGLLTVMDHGLAPLVTDASPP